MIASAVLVALLAALQAAPAPQRTDSLVVEVAGRVTVLRESDLAGLARDSLRVAFHGQAAHTYIGVRLVDILRLAGVPIDSLHAPATTSRVVIEAADGYRVIFSLPELLPGYNGRRVLVAFRLDGSPLPAQEGPWRLLAPDDGGEHARWVHRVVAIRVRRE